MHFLFSLRRLAAILFCLVGFSAYHARADEIVPFLESRNGHLNLGTYEYWFEVSSPQMLRFRLEALSGTSNITISRRLPNSGVDELILFARYGGSYGPLGDKGYWAIPLQTGTHTIRLNSSITSGWIRMTEITLGDPGPSNQAPSIEWQEAPGSATVGQTYRVSARAHDPDGNLTQVNVWKSGQPFAFAGGGDGTTGDSGNPTSDGSPGTITFTAQAVDSTGATSPTITHMVTIHAPANRSPSVTLLAPGTQTITAGATLIISSRATDPDGNLTNHNLDIQRPAGDWNFQGGFAAGEPYLGGPVGSGADSTRSASFTFNDVGTYYVRSAADDGSGWVHSSTVAITVVPANRAPTIAWVTHPATAGHQQSYSISARGQDADGNLAQVNIWKAGAPFAFAGGGNGFSGDSGNPTSDNGPQTITFVAQAVDSAGLTSPTISHTVTIGGPPNVAPTIAWVSAPATAGSGQSYTMSARASDANGNLSTVRIWKDGSDFASAGGGNGSTSEASSHSADTGPRTITYTARATDAAGAASPTIAHTVTVEAPPPIHFTLVTSASSGGTVSPGGTYVEGSIASVTAIPDSLHDFAGWNGDASGAGNPLGVVMDRNKAVHALFTPKSYPLVTSATGGGSVTAGGTYPHGTVVTISATPVPNARFTGWAGDATGTAPTIAVTMNGPKSVQALFVAKLAQTLTFPNLSDVSIGTGAVILNAVASSGLPVHYIVTGPATLVGNQLQATAPGAISVQARQEGDEFYLPAAPVVRTFNVAAPAILKYRAPNRTLLQDENNRGSVPFVIEQP